MAEARAPQLLSLAPQLGTFAVILAIAAAVIPGTQNARAPSTPAPDARIVPLLADPVTPQEAFEQFLFDAQLTDLAGAPLASRYKDRVLIATLPDPVGTDFGYWFDQCLESIGRAMADADGYGLDRYWFAWLETKAAAGAKPVADRRNEQLGVLVYRKNATASDRRVVLIVRENALSGVNRDAMLQALDLLPASSEPRQTVRILGPSFSGSLPSILESLNRWEDGSTADVRIISGSAIGIPDDRALSPAMQPKVKSLTIRSMNAHISVQMNAMIRYLATPGETTPDDDFMPREGKTSPLDLSRVAFLIESNSGFGASALQAASFADGTPSFKTTPLILRFPMHISKLTAILSTEQRLRDEKLGLSKRGTLGALDETRAKHDLVPAADELRTAELNKRLLDDYCAVLRRERTRFIGILATDPRDKLYLFDLLRRQCPNARLFTHGADNHFVHPSYYRPMRGVLLVGTYPLIPQSQEWTRVWGEEPETRRLPFPSTYAQGLYNGVLAQLGEDRKMIDYRPPAFAPTGEELHLHPPLWISTVNERGSFTPLAYFVNGKRKDSEEQRWGKFGKLTYELPEKAAMEERAHRRSVSYTPPPLDDLALAMAGVIILSLLSIPPILRAYPGLRAAIFNPNRHMGLRDWYAFLISFGIMLAATPFAIYFHTLFRHEHFHYFLFSEEYPLDGLLFALVALVGMLAPVLLFFTMLPLLSWVAARFGLPATPSSLPRWRHALTILAGAVTLLFAVTACYRVYRQGHAENSRQLLFLERAADLFSGASAILPCLLIGVGIIGFAMFGLQLLKLRTEFRVESPYPTAESELPPATEPTGLALRRIKAGVQAIDAMWDARTLQHRWGIYAIAVLAGLAFAVPSYFNAHRTWDGRFWDRLFLIGFSVLASYAAVSAFRFILLWRHVKVILRGIAGVPMVGAFDRLPERTSAMLARFLLVGRRRSSDLAVPYRLLAELRASTAGTCRVAVDSALELNPEAANIDPPVSGVQASRLSTAAREIVHALLPVWTRKNVCEAYGSQPLGKDEPPQGAQAIAEQFIAVQAIFFVSQYFTQLRYFAYMGTFTAGCLLFALTEYHFEPEYLVMMSGAGLVMCVVGVVAWGLVQINRNELVSRVTRTTPGRFSLDSAPLMMNALQLAGPLLLILLMQLSGRLRSVVEPAVSLFR